MKTFKNHVTLFVFLIAVTSQAQQSIHYKAIIKDGNGNILANDLIAVKFTILEGAGMVNVYQEIHTPTTDDTGIIVVNIGEGSVNNGVYANIDWGGDTHFLNIQVDTGGGYVDMGNEQFKAVPYALSLSKESARIDDLKDAKMDANGSSLFLGVGAGIMDDGTDNANLGLGFEALKNNGQGYENTASGYKTLKSNTTGFNNTAYGTQSMASNTTGILNIANGAFSLFSNIDGYGNAANGAFALYANTSGWGNTAIGFNTLYNNTNGLSNVAVGYGALSNNTSGGGNIAIGYNALSNITDSFNNIAIGYNAQVPNATDGSQIRMGNTEIGYAGIQVPWTVTSDLSWKKEIRELPYGLNMISKLKPVDYIRKNNDKETREMGFIAQDVEQTIKDLGYDDQGFLTKDDEGRMSLRYNDLFALLTKAIQEQQDIIETQGKKYENLLKRVEKLEAASNQ